MNAIVKPKRHRKADAVSEAKACCAEIENLLESELGHIHAAELRRLMGHIVTLSARITTLQGLIDGYALNRSNEARLRIASDNILFDAATRHGSLTRFLKKR
jgi:hypothetical protein